MATTDREAVNAFIHETRTLAGQIDAYHKKWGKGIDQSQVSNSDLARIEGADRRLSESIKKLLGV